MSRLWLGNFGFEEELAGWSSQPVSSTALRALTGDLAACWLAVAEPGDAIHSPTGPPTFDRSALDRLGVPDVEWIDATHLPPTHHLTQLEPWGLTAGMVALAAQAGLAIRAVEPAAVARVNARAFRWELEQELGLALPGSVCLHTLDEVRQHLENWGPRCTDWVIKANYGMAGRQRQAGRGNDLNAAGWTWLQKKLVTGPVVFEPWLERISEAGIQLDIPQAGAPQLLGIAILETAPNGTYRGSRITLNSAEVKQWTPAAEMGLRIAERVQQAGYWGPLGIDAMCFRGSDGQPQLRFLQDLNARWTMGRLALGWRRYLPAGSQCVWRHGGKQESQPSVTVIPTSSRSWLEITPA